MGILTFTKPKKAMSTEEYKRDYAGTYMQNIAPEQLNLWRAQLIKGKLGARVEVKTSRLGCSTKIVVYAPGAHEQWGEVNKEIEVCISHNGTACMNYECLSEFIQAINEAYAIILTEINTHQ